jgi:beta-lactamase class D
MVKIKGFRMQKPCPSPGLIFAKTSAMLKVFSALFLLSFVFYSCSPNNVTEDNSLKIYFDSSRVQGCFGLFDNGTGQFTIYNLPRYRDSSYLPASTFKIINSLIGIQTGVITDEKMVIKWDGIKSWNEDWNKDLSMEEAFRVSAVNYYQEVARRIGEPVMKKWIDSLGYGNRDISGPIDSFWINNRLRISPDEQLGLVKKLYFGQLPFFNRTQEIVRKVMLQESNANYRLSYKTGWGTAPSGHQIGWVVGWIEENNHPYFFVLNIESIDPHIDMVAVRMHILKSILGKLGFLQGKK